MLLCCCASYVSHPSHIFTTPLPEVVQPTVQQCQAETFIHDLSLEPQERCTKELAAVWRSHEQHRDIVRLALSAVGRGGSSDLGQRIRDDILVVQSANNAKGGMMEQWHQKVQSPILFTACFCHTWQAVELQFGLVAAVIQLAEMSGIERGKRWLTNSLIH